MAVSVFELFRIGIGPSSSHTVGPMRAAGQWARKLRDQGTLGDTARIRVEMFGSLAATGLGHGTDRAILLGLAGEDPETIDPDVVGERVASIETRGRMALLGEHEIDWDRRQDLHLDAATELAYHPNGMRFTALDATGESRGEGTYYSIGGGFVVDEAAAGADRLDDGEARTPYPFTSSRQLLHLCCENDVPISEVMWRNEVARRTPDEARDGLVRIAEAMHECIERGCRNEGTLPGPMKVPRRAPTLCRKLRESVAGDRSDPLDTIDWVDVYALAVNEENAAGGRVVTAPTNGAAGIIPAVLRYCDQVYPPASEERTCRFLLTAGAIGVLYKENASISGAEVGCQGEVGVACSMAAGALAAVLGGTPDQVENAAEIGMEHNLGLTCDPIHGLVQVPCIERNAMAAVKAINAARMALRGDGHHLVSLDQVIDTMRATGADMQSKYKETALGGLAVNVTEC